MDLILEGCAQPYASDGRVLDPLRDEDVLQEAVVIGTLAIPAGMVAAVLLDLRPALHPSPGNTGLLIVRGLRASSSLVPSSPHRLRRSPTLQLMRLLA